jgi:hypothetical protein
MIIQIIGANVVSLSSKAEMEFVKNNVDSTPAIFEIWIGLERDSMTGMAYYNFILSFIDDQLNLGLYLWNDGTVFQFNGFPWNNQTQTCAYMVCSYSLK